ncbi:MAG: hydroxymethylbilane synthase [Alphaproteobacteria bacterium]|nr:hydroxymethylbilane synthase [Alphaproteobacteria bacterium]
MNIIKIGTRKSLLALKQAELVKNALEKIGVFSEIIKIESSGDKIQNKPLWEIGGKGLFCKELDKALINKECDIAVHSAKDMETELAVGTEIFATLPRQDVSDVFISKYTIENIPSGSVIGTCSLRRKSQILNIRDDLVIKSIRGNVETRLKKIEQGEFDATFLAMAGLNRLGINADKWQKLSEFDFIPSSGQGTIAIQGLKTNIKIKQLLQKINDKNSFLQLSYERSFLSGVNGDCKTPVGAYAYIKTDGTVLLHTFYGDEFGKSVDKQIKIVKSSKDCYKLGEQIKLKS